MTDVIGGKRASSATSNEDENLPLNEEKRPRRAGERKPLSNQANYITVSVPDDGRRTRVTVRDVDHFRQERFSEENFLVWACSKSWRDLKEFASALLARSAQNDASVQSTQVVAANKVAPSTELWLRKYAPSSYMDLVSDEATNRVVLQWFRLWDKCVFGKELKSKSSYRAERNNNQPQQQGQQNKWGNNRNAGGGGNFNQKQLGPSMDPTESWPAQRICLLTGPPGLGKTTLAHIAARHCGYEIVEVNASDDRSANVFRDYLESVVETRGMLNVTRDGDAKTKPKPACLILDEIDGAPQAAIEVLLSYVTSADPDKGEKKTRKKNKKDHELLRPVICICNDQYATALRNLRRHCFVVSCLPPPPERLIFRVGEIAKREKIEIESNAVSNIVERARGDIRVCINIMQTLKAACSNNISSVNHLPTTQRRHRDVIRITSDQVARLPRMGFSKDIEQSMFDCLQTIFKLPPLSSNTSRFDCVQSSVQMNTDHELLVNGIFENYTNARIRDDFLIAASQMADWLAVTDTMQASAMSIAGAEIGYSMTYTTTPLIATACHLMFAVPQPGRLMFPKTSGEMRQLQTQRHNQLTSFMAGIAPAERVYFAAPSAVVFDLVPSVLEIIQPTLRPVSSQLYSSAERAEISRVVEAMASLGLTFVQRLSAPSNDQTQHWQSRGSQLGFYLEPPIDSLVVFEKRPNQGEMNKMVNSEGDETNKAAHSAVIWRLPQAVRQLLASEITLYLARKAAVRATGPLYQPQSDETVMDEKNKKSTTAGTAALLAQNEKANEMTMKQMNQSELGSEQKVQTAISSFFTRTTTSKKNSAGHNSFNTLIRSPPTGRSRDKIWYRFNEGFSNAVRRPIRVKQFF